MNAACYNTGMDTADKGFDPLLPLVAGYIENVEKATLSEVKKSIEHDLRKSVSDAAVVRALQNGVKLGVFRIEREFKVRREFSMKEMTDMKKCGKKPFDVRNNNSGSSKSKRRKTLMDYVKRQREKRRNKFSKARKYKNAFQNYDFSYAEDELYNQLCQTCKRSVDTTLSSHLMGSDMSLANGSDVRDDECNALRSSDDSVVSHVKSEKEEPKSKLLVEKNPMETDPPYYDIFS